METYLPIIKTTLSDWFLLTLDNPLYAASLATIVFILTAIIYSIRVASLKKKNIASEKAHIEIQDKLNTALNTAKQEMQHIQEELVANTEQMQKDQELAKKETERATRMEELLSQRNKQVAGIIQSLHTSFDLGERPVPVMGDIKAEGLWQQHDRVINLLTTRLQNEQQAKAQLQQSYQAETVKRAEKEALIETLQATLAAQTSQLSELEQALEEQKAELQQQQDKAQQLLSQTLEKHLSELARLTELEQQALDLVKTRRQLTQLEEKLTVKDALITQLEKTKPVDQVKTQTQTAPINEFEKENIAQLKNTDEDVSSALSDHKQQPVGPEKEGAGGLSRTIKKLFGKTKQEPIIAEVQSVEAKQDEPEIQPLLLEVNIPSVSSAKGQFGKLKNLFGSKQQPEETKQSEAEIQSALVEVEQSPVSPVQGQFGKLKNLFGTKQQPEETRQLEPEIQPAPVSPAKDRHRNKKYYFGDIKKESEGTKHNEPETQPEPLEAEQTQLIIAKGQLGKLKKIFGSKQQQLEDIKQEEKETNPAALAVEKQPVNAAKGQFGKLKKIFGSKKQPEEILQEEIRPAPLDYLEQPPVSAAKGQLGKLKNLFGRAK